MTVNMTTKVTEEKKYPRDYYYHIRFGTGAVTLCYLKNGDGSIVARGIAVCSPKEKSFIKKIGRQIAFGRAMKAYNITHGVSEVPDRWDRQGDPFKFVYKNNFRFLGSYSPYFSDLEKSLPLVAKSI